VRGEGTNSNKYRRLRAGQEGNKSSQENVLQKVATTDRMLLPRMDICCTLIGFWPLGTSLTVLRCVFMATSTPGGKMCQRRKDIGCRHGMRNSAWVQRSKMGGAGVSCAGADAYSSVKFLLSDAVVLAWCPYTHQ
jgi:hypothetical protein